MQGIVLSIVFIFFMAGVFLTWYFSHKAKMTERMMLIEKGMDLPAQQPIRLFEGNFPWLRVGIVAIGMGAGIILGVNYHDFGMAMGGIFLFGGIGMFLASFMGKPKVQK
jgi:hypothetical protein